MARHMSHWFRHHLFTSAIVLAISATASGANAAERLCDPSFEDCRAPLLALIDAERQGIDVAFWFMEDQYYSARIIARFKAGVPVRLIVDPRANSTYPLNQTRLNEFQAARNTAGLGIPMVKKTTGAVRIGQLQSERLRARRAVHQLRDREHLLLG
jgi:hypothetical protein